MFKFFSKMTSGIRPVVISGPSGVGKSTLLKKLFVEYPEKFGLSVSHTTRKQRPGEVEGEHYHFTTINEMKAEIDQGNFIEYAEFSGNMYGTSKQAVKNVLNDNRICVLDVDQQGVESIKNTDIDPIYIFIKPPSIEILEARLRSRGTETDESLKRRMNTAGSALEYSEKPGVYDIIITNDDIDQSYQLLKSYLLKSHAVKSCNGTNNNISSQWNDVSLETPLASVKDLASGDHTFSTEQYISSVAEIPISPTKTNNAGAAVFPVETKQSPPLLMTNQSNVIDLQEEPIRRKDEESTMFCGKSSCNLL